MSEVIQSNIQLWRAKALDGSITREEMKEALAQIRSERVGASERSSASKARTSTAKAKAAPIDSNSLLGELDGL